MDKIYYTMLEELVAKGHCTVEELEEFSDQELEAIARSALEIKESGESLTLKKIEASDYKFPLPAIEEYIESYDWLGNELGHPRDDYGNKLEGEQRQIYDFWVEELKDIYEYENKYTQILLTGGIGLGKTTMMNVIQSYDLLKLLALKNPQRHYGLMPSTQIVLAFFSIDLTLAANVAYAQFQAMLTNSKKFRNLMFYNRQKSEGFRMLPHPRSKITFVLGSRISHTLGKAVFSAQMDEANFGQERADKQAAEKASQVYENYTNLLRRKESRFLHAPGHFCIGSSKKTSADFLERHIEQHKGRPKVKVIDAPQYVVKRCRRGLYSGKTFRVLLGDTTRDPRILKEDEVVSLELEDKIEEIPIEHYDAYDTDIIEALRDISGMSAQPQQALYTNRDAVRRAVDENRKNPWKYNARGKTIPNTIGLTFHGNDQLHDYLIKENLFWNKGKLPYERSPRFVGIDTGYANDAAGLAMVCKAGAEKVKLEDGSFAYKTRYYPDLYIRVTGKGKDHLALYKLKEFVKFLKTTLRINIEGVVTDGFQSVQLRQDLEILYPHMTICENSVDKDDVAHMFLRTQFYSGTFVGMYKDENIEVEIFDLRHLTTTGRGKSGQLIKMVVDHPMIASDKFVGRKDVMDALANAIDLCAKSDRNVSPEEQRQRMEDLKKLDLDKMIQNAENEAEQALRELDKMDWDNLLG